MPIMMKNDRSLEELIQDLKIVMKKIEEDPDTSSWAIRMTIKALVEKAEKRMEDAI